MEEPTVDIPTQTERLLRSTYKREVAELRGYKSRSFYVDYKTITNNDLADAVIRKNWAATIYFKDALRKVGVEESILTDLTVRYTNLPVVSIRNMKSGLIGQTRSYEGIVRRVSEVKSKATVAVFECSYCTKRVSVPQGIDITYPEGKCEWCEKTAKWKVVSDAGTFTDFQTVVVQEFPEDTVGGDQPKSITTVFMGELCGLLIPGNRVTVVGTLKLKKIKSDAGLIFEPYMEGNSIIVKDELYDNIVVDESDLKQFEVMKQDPDLIYKLSSSIAPTVFGNEEVKRGILLQLFGGVPKTISGTRIRGDIHVLLIGDPGIAKSVIMKHVVSLLPRGIFTHGYSSSKAGLTATAVKEEEGWVLEAGALVLANGGLCAVDELDKMNDNDREALHGAMEQQEIDIAKAGIVAKLYTRCSLLAAANPKLGRFDLCTSLSSQFNLAPTLLSRFDLIYPLTDVPEEKRDSDIADYILNTHITQTVTEVIPHDLFRKYIAHAKTISPRLTPEAAGMLKDYYTKVRSLANNMHTVPITARSLEALVRLSEAAARMRLSETVTPDDAKVVITIVDSCLRKIAYDSQTKSFDIDRVVGKVSARNRNVVGRITDIIISESDETGVSKVCDIIKDMKERYGVQEQETINNIELMRQETRIFMPRDGYVKLMKQTL